jgi:hypothetical protein
VSISSWDDTDSTESDAEYKSEHDSGLDMCAEDDADAMDGVDSDGDLDMEWNGDIEVAENQEEEDEVEEYGEEEEDKYEAEDKDEDNGKAPRMIGQGETVHRSADDKDTTVDDQPIMLPQPGQEMSKHTPCPQPPVPATLPQTPEHRPQPQSPVTDPLCGLEHLGCVMTQKSHPAVPSVREVEAAGNMSDVDVDQ